MTKKLKIMKRNVSINVANLTLWTGFHDLKHLLNIPPMPLRSLLRDI